MDLPASAPSSSDEPGLMASLRQFSSDLVEYGEARLRLLQAEVKRSVGRLGGAIGLVCLGGLFVCLGYLPLLGVQVLYLAETVFGGTYMAPLLIVSALHFFLALVFAALGWKRWKVNQETLQAELKTLQAELKEPVLPEPRIMS